MALISPIGATATASVGDGCALIQRRTATEEICPPSQGQGRPASWRAACLALQVQADAFRLAPFAYLQAIGWRIRGLRLRSRNRIAALAGRSPHAYALWIERHALAERALPPPSIRCGIILPVIDCRGDRTSLPRTLNSIAQAEATAEPIVIGDDRRAGTLKIERPRDLARLITGERTWLLPMQAGDRLAGRSLAFYADAAAQHSESWLVYADDDLIGPDGTRRAPHFKPDWNPELFEHHDFITGSSIVRADRLTLQDLPDVGWAENLVRSARHRGPAPIHVKQVLHHRISRPLPQVPSKPSNLMDDIPPVTAIIPTRNRHELLRSCLGGLRNTRYPCLETIIIDNGSDEPETLTYLSALEQEGASVLHLPGPFNYSALNNAAVRHAHGDVLCFLNNDLEMSDPDWLALLVRHARKPDVGAVGARLLYPDGTIQHAGVFIGIGGGAGHAHRFQRSDEPGYFERARLPQRVSAVTGACLVVEKDKFLAVGGFDEELFPVAFNDVDLCLKLNDRGWHSFYEPRSALIHHESKSRGSDRLRANRTRFAGELARLKQKWNTDRIRDPFHHPSLSPFTEQFLIAV